MSAPKHINKFLFAFYSFISPACAASISPDEYNPQAEIDFSEPTPPALYMTVSKGNCEKYSFYVKIAHIRVHPDTYRSKSQISEAWLQYDSGEKTDISSLIKVASDERITAVLPGCSPDKFSLGIQIKKSAPSGVNPRYTMRQLGLLFVKSELVFEDDQPVDTDDILPLLN